MENGVSNSLTSASGELPPCLFASLPGEIMNLHVTKRHHAHSLPNTQANTRSNSTVETLDAVGIIDVFESLANSQVLGAVWIVGLALHFNADNFDRLVPGRETTTQAGSEDLLPGRELLT